MSDLTIDNLEKGDKTLRLSQGNDKGKGGLERFYEKNKNKIFKLTEDEEIDCNKYNYYYETCQPFKFGGWCFAEKIDSIFGCNTEVKRYNRKYLYKVERKNRPTGEKLKSGFTSLFKKSADATPAPADNAAPAPVTNTDANAPPPQRKRCCTVCQRNRRTQIQKPTQVKKPAKVKKAAQVPQIQTLNYYT